MYLKLSSVSLRNVLLMSSFRWWTHARIDSRSDWLTLGLIW